MGYSQGIRDATSRFASQMLDGTGVTVAVCAVIRADLEERRYGGGLYAALASRGAEGLADAPREAGIGSRSR